MANSLKRSAWVKMMVERWSDDPKEEHLLWIKRGGRDEAAFFAAETGGVSRASWKRLECVCEAYMHELDASDELQAEDDTVRIFKFKEAANADTPVE